MYFNSYDFKFYALKFNSLNMSDIEDVAVDLQLKAAR